MSALMSNPPPRHCTNCGARIWSLSSIGMHDRTSAGRYADLCNRCDPDHPDAWELFTTGGHRPDSNRRSTR